MFFCFWDKHCGINMTTLIKFIIHYFRETDVGSISEQTKVISFFSMCQKKAHFLRQYFILYVWTLPGGMRCICQPSHMFTALKNSLATSAGLSYFFQINYGLLSPPSEFFLKPFCLPLLNHPLIQRKASESWLSFNAAAARTLSLNKVSVAWI